jgi:hypothetical protein
MNTVPEHAYDLAIVAPSAAGLPHIRRLERSSGSPDAAYRHLAAVILRLDVATLGSELRASRLKFSLQQAA